MDSTRAATDPDELLACYGIEVVPARPASGPASAVARIAAEVGFRVALNVARSPWRHRIDLGAVRLDLAGTADVVRAYNELQRCWRARIQFAPPMIMKTSRRHSAPKSSGS